MTESLPPGWAWTTLSAIAEIKGGITKGQRRRESDVLREVPYLRVANVQRGYLDLGDVKTIAATCDEIEALRLKAGDILFNEGGDRDKLGRGWVWRDEIPECIHQNHVFRVRPCSTEIASKFVSWYANSEGQQYFIDEGKQTTNLASINLTKLSAFPVLLAPAAEQRRIVEAIEERFSRLDAAVAGLKRVRQQLKRYRASVLKAACEGRLVPTEAELARAEGREYEPADRLLARILEERRARGGPKYKEPAAPDLANLPAPPDGWVWTTIDAVTVLLRNGYGQMPNASAGTRILRISAVRPRALNINDVRFLSGAAEDYAQYLVNSGDVLFTRYNGNTDLVGVCATVRTVPEPTVHPDKLIRCELVSEFCLPLFVEIAANVGASRDHMARKVRTTAGQSGISGPDIRTTPIPLPPLAEQERIVAEVERRLSVVEKAEAAVEANLRRAERMRQAILKRAFEGKLVPQDPNDEPASALLERIRAERAGEAVNGRVKRSRKGSGQLELPGLPSPPAPLSRARERGSRTGR